MCLHDWWKACFFLMKFSFYCYVDSKLLSPDTKECQIIYDQIIAGHWTRDKPLPEPMVKSINSLRSRQDGRHFPDDIFKCIFLNENISILIDILLKFVLKSQINNIPALVQIMACRLVGDKPLSEPMMVILLTHICVTQPQWLNRATNDLIQTVYSNMHFSPP